jgi:lysozyme
VKTSPSGLAFLARQEGEVDHAYLDEAHLPTIGIGHLIRPGEHFPSNGITHEQALQLLAQDLAPAESAVNAVGVALMQNQFDACVSLAFNIGAGGFASSTVCARLKAGDFAGAADAFLMWDKISVEGRLVPSKGLLARRNAERALFLSA